MREWFGYFLGVCVMLLSIPNFIMLFSPPHGFDDAICVLAGILCLTMGIAIIADQRRHNRRCMERSS